MKSSHHYVKGTVQLNSTAVQIIMRDNTLVIFISTVTRVMLILSTVSRPPCHSFQHDPKKLHYSVS